MAQSLIYINEVFGIKNNQNLLTSGICFNIKQKLALENLNYYFGTIADLNKMIVSFGKTEATSQKKFPILWLEMPFTIKRGGDIGLFGTVEGLRLFILHNTSKVYKPEERFEKIYKAVIHPIYLELLQQISKNRVFNEPYINNIDHSITDLYYWGDDQANVLSDIVDITEIKFNSLKVNNKIC